MKIKHLLIAAALVAAFLLGKNTHGGEYLNMNSITDWSTTETGLMLYTVFGNGYYIEK